MRIRGFLLAALIVALAFAVPAVASADTVLGGTSQPAGSTANPCPPGPTPPAKELLFSFGPGGPFVPGPLSVPSSPGPLVVSHWAVNAAGVTTSEQLTLVVFRLQTTPTPSVIVTGTDTETLTPPASPVAAVEQFTLSQPILVQAGDLIGQYAPGSTAGFTCYWSGGSGETNAVDGFPESSPPTAGQQFAPMGLGVATSNADLNLAATLSPVNYDAALSLTAGPSNAVVGQPAVLTATVANNGPLAGPVTFTDPVPSGLTVVSASIGSGSCSTNAAVNIVTCSVTTLAAKQSTNIVIVVTPKAAQTYTDSGTVAVTGGGTDPNPANNSATTTLKVGKVGAPTQCQVPKLGGAPLAIVKRVLPPLGCAVGKTTKSHSKSVPKGDVISTNPRVGTYALGRKIALTVSGGKPPKKKKHKK